VRLQADLDAAVLAGAAEMAAGGDPKLQSKAKLENLSATPIVSVDATTATVSATVATSTPSPFFSLLGHNTLPISVLSTATSGSGADQEVAIAFDTTGSMAGAKLQSAQQAANQLVDILFTQQQSSSPNQHMKVGLVPFTYYVNVGTQYADASWITGAQAYSTQYCYTNYPDLVWQNITYTCPKDGVPSQCTRSVSTGDYNNPQNVCEQIQHVWNGCVGSQNSPADTLPAASASNPVPAVLTPTSDFNYPSCSAPLIRMSQDPTVIKTAVNAMQADGETYIAPGLLWAWRLLAPASDSGPFADGEAYGAVKKTIVLMTDGANTHSPRYPDHEGTDVVLANKLTAQVCQNIKAQNIVIYAIAFEVTDQTIKDLLAMQLGSALLL
jgi:Mg-chelatase subunit ChlD